MMDAKTFIKKWEQCRLVAYKDGGGVWTIGWGATGADVREGVTWTQQQADDRFNNVDYPRHERAAQALVKVALNANQMAAWVSIIYNCGAGKSDGIKGDLADSDLLVYINSRQWLNAGKEWIKWHFDNGKPVLGLLRRRLEEASLFLS